MPTHPFLCHPNAWVSMRRSRSPSPWARSAQPSPSENNVDSLFAQPMKGSRPSSEAEDNELSGTIEPKLIKIVVQSEVSSVAFLADEERMVSGHNDGKIRCWQVRTGQQDGVPMNTGSAVRSIAASKQWIVAGTEDGRVVVWNAKSQQRVKEFTTHEKAIKSVDISPDETRIAIASDDRKAKVWFPDNKWLYGWEDRNFYTVKFSPGGSLLALTHAANESNATALSICDTQDFKYLSGVFISIRSITWDWNGKKLFVLSDDGYIHCLDVPSLNTLSKWPIHSKDKARWISLSNNGTFFAASANSSISFWDTSYKQIGSVIHHPSPVESMAISSSYDLVIAGGLNITLWEGNVLPGYISNHTRGKSIESRLNETIAGLRTQLDRTQRAAKEREDTIKLVRGDLATQNSRSMDLEKTVEQLRAELADSQEKHVVQAEQISDLEANIQQLRIHFAYYEQNANRIAEQSHTDLENSQQIIRAHRQKHGCEILYADGHIFDAAKSLLDMKKDITDNLKADTIIMDWFSAFTNKCIDRFERTGDEATGRKKHEEALAAYVFALSLAPSNPYPLLTKWVRTKLHRVSAEKVLDDADKLNLPKSLIYRATCDVLEQGGQVTEAVEYLRRMQSDVTSNTIVDDGRSQWELDFQRRCRERLEKPLDAGLDTQKYHKAIRWLSTIVSLDPPDRVDLLVKRSNARTMMKSWEEALKDADEVIKLKPSSHRGYELRYAALHGVERFADAVEAFDTMLLRLAESHDTRTRDLCSQYADARPTIREIIHATISYMPRVLIDTTSGCLLGRSAQADVFQTLPIFDKLVSSMTREVDHAWIRREVKSFYHYVMFSHKWGSDEPLFQRVERVTVYKLETSPANMKLRTFCEIARRLGFRWAWSDTCCIDKKDNVILQESLVAMFAWYRGSTLTIIHLYDVTSEDEDEDALKNSVWNSRVWTHQEYVAAERVKFYTRDWKPYRGLTLENHKEAPDVLREMEVPGVSTEQVAVLRPGLDRVREKLYLASRRQTTLVEDIAYSMLGILNASIPIMYGEGNRAVGRLLEYVLTGSGDASILAWTGTANEYNSCLPLDLTVYDPLVPPHIPLMETEKLDLVVENLRSSLPDVILAIALYDELHKLRSPTVISGRLQLPGILSRAKDVTRSGRHKYRAMTMLFGDVEIRTTSNLVGMKGLCLIHPWICPLLDQEFSRGGAEVDEMTQALRLVARLKQPFGALLFEQVSRTEYRRVASDSLIVIQFRKEVSLTDLMQNIVTIEAL